MAADKKDPKKEKKVKRPTAQKRDDQNEKRRQINRSFKSKVRSALRILEEGLAKKDAEATKKNLSEIYSLMDKGVKKGIYTPNTANRTKARIAASTAKASV
jgi:small subunit ribosomal protein S20